MPPDRISPVLFGPVKPVQIGLQRLQPRLIGGNKSGLDRLMHPQHDAFRKVARKRIGTGLLPQPDAVASAWSCR